MSAMSDIWENKFIDWFFRGQSLGVTGASAGAGSGPTSLYVGLLTAAPSDAGGGTEVSGSNYSRVAVTSSLANWAGTQAAGSTTASTGTSGTTSNNNAINFPSPSGAWGTVSHFGVYDASTTGNLLYHGALSISKPLGLGDNPYILAGALTVQVDN